MDRMIKVKDEDSDIVIVLPGNREVTLQYRSEGPSLDILFPEPWHVNNWEGSDMKPAKSINKTCQHIRIADQLCIPLDPVPGKEIGKETADEE
jgi:hypothetical protein